MPGSTSRHPDRHLDPADADTRLDMPAPAFTAEVDPNRWFFSGTGFIALRKIKTGAYFNGYLFERYITAGPAYRIKGVQVIVSNKIATGTALLADT